MKFIKQHSFSLICAAAALVGIALGAWGMTSSSSVEERLNEGEGLTRRVRMMAGGGASVAAIDQLNERIQNLQRSLADLQSAAEAVNRRPQLIEGFFPNVEEGREAEFQDACRRAFTQLLGSLNPGQPPTTQELRNWQTMIEEEVRQANEPGGTNPVDVYGEAVRDIIFDADARASIWHARSCFIYASEDSLEKPAAVFQTRQSRPPSPIDLWFAQISLWIQQDLVGATKKLNDDAAAAAPGGPQQAWVGVLPVKQLVGIRTTDYIYPDTKDDRDVDRLKPLLVQNRFVLAVDVGEPISDARKVLTQRAGGSEYDVQHVRLVVVMDPRRLPDLINEILRVNLYTLLNVRYRAIPQAATHVGILYGSDPVIHVELDFAMHWLNSVFGGLIPKDSEESAK